MRIVTVTETQWHYSFVSLQSDVTEQVIELIATGELPVSERHAEKQIQSLFIFKDPINSCSKSGE